MTLKVISESISVNNTRLWQPDVAQEPRTEVKGDEVTLFNVRNCDCRTETDYIPAAPELVARVIGQFRDAG